VFGSCATGLNLPKSDIDLLCYYPAQREQSLMNKLESALAKSGFCSGIESIKSAKCPIIKLKDKESGINVDISFNRENGVNCVCLVQ
jgi:non-canonical poly(A) RNA polymerase PAPD5/7